MCLSGRGNIPNANLSQEIEIYTIHTYKVHNYVYKNKKKRIKIYFHQHNNKLAHKYTSTLDHTTEHMT